MIKRGLIIVIISILLVSIWNPASAQVHNSYSRTGEIGIEMTMTPEAQAKMMFIHRGEVKSTNISVKNVGEEDFTIVLNKTLNLNGNEGMGWKLYINKTELDLNPNETKILKVSVRGPNQGHMNDFIEVFLNASVKDSPSQFEVISFRTFYIGCSGFSLTTEKDHLMAHPGEPVEFNINLTYHGDIFTDVGLSVEGPKEWYVGLEPYEYQMEPQSNVSFPFIVAPPYDIFLSGAYSFTITAFDKDVPSIKDRVTVHVTVVPCKLISMYITPSYRFVDPGGVADFEIIINNQCGHCQIVIFDIMDGVGDWNVYFDRSSVSVADRSEVEVTLTVVVPPDARPGIRLNLRVRAYHEIGTVLDEASATVFSGQIRDVAIEANPVFNSVNPGDSASFQINITNNGNGREFLDMFLIGVPEGWHPSITLKDEEIDALSIEPGETARFMMEMDVPSDEIGGFFPFSVGFSNYEEVSVVISMNVTVNIVHAVEIVPYTTQRVGYLGTTISYPLLIRNVGNGEELVSLILREKDLPQEWRYYFTHKGEDTDFLILDVMDVQRIMLNIEIPISGKDSLYDFYMIVILSNGMKKYIKFELYILMSNLEISNIRYNPINIKKNEPVMIEVAVLNRGNLAAYNVAVTLIVDNHLLSSEIMDLILPNSTTHFIFQWTPNRSEDYVLRFIVDPDNVILEGNEANNIIKDRIRVFSNGYEFNNLRTMFWPILGIISIMVLLGAVTRIYRFYRI